MRGFVSHLSFLFILLAHSAQAQNDFFHPETHNQQWSHYFVSARVVEKLSWDSDAGYRWGQWFGERSQYILRTGLYYKLTPHFTLGGGFAHLGFYRSESLSKLEFRPHQQISGKHSVGKLSFSQRLRWEQRWFLNRDEDGVSGRSKYVSRYRYLASLNIPLLRSGEQQEELIGLSVGGEILLQSGRSTGHLFDQSRILVGPVVHMSPSSTLELLYQGQTAGYSGHYVRTDILWLRLVQKFDLRAAN